MSQFPSQFPGPYSYPAYAQDPYAAARAPARRAGVLMIIIGGLLTLLGMCAGSTLFFPEHMIRQQIEIMPPSPDGQLTVPQMRKQALVSVIVSAVSGVVLIALGLFVRRGSKGAIITGIVLTSLAVLQFGLGTLGFLALAAGAPIMILMACFAAIPLALFILLLVWLIQSLRGSSDLQRMQAMYQQQYWQYQQQQQMYGQGGYGYQTAPAPPKADQSGPPSNEPPAPGTS